MRKYIISIIVALALLSCSGAPVKVDEDTIVERIENGEVVTVEDGSDAESRDGLSTHDCVTHSPT